MQRGGLVGECRHEVGAGAGGDRQVVGGSVGELPDGRMEMLWVILSVRLSDLANFRPQVAGHLAHSKKYRVSRLSCSMRRWRQRDISLHSWIEGGGSKRPVNQLFNQIHLHKAARNPILWHFLDD